MKAKPAAKSKPTAVKLMRADKMDERGENVTGICYKISEMIGAVILEEKWRVGDSLTEEEAILLSKDTAVVVCC